MVFRTSGFTPTPNTPSDGYDVFESLVDGISLVTSEHPNSHSAAIVDIQKTLTDGYAFTTLLPRASGMSLEPGQTFIYDAVSDTMIPGASGDSSLKLREVTNPNATIKSGYLLLSDGKELALSSDLSVNLTTAAGGGSPLDGYYYLYIDLDQLPAQTTVAGREIYALTQSQFAAKTTTPDSINLARYIPIGVVNRSSGSWSSSDFATLAFRRHDKPSVVVSPVVYSVGSITAASHPYNTTISHNMNVPVVNQSWNCIIEGYDGYIVQPTTDSWLLDIVDANSIKVDFSFLATGDVATIKMQDLGVSATVIPTKTYNSGAKTGTALGGASVNISHGLGMVPTSVVLQREVTSGVWENLDPSNYIAVSATAITGDLSSMASDTLRIVCSAAPDALALSGNVTLEGNLNVTGSITSGTSTLVLDGPNMTIQSGTSQGLSFKTNAGATTAMSMTSAGVATFNAGVAGPGTVPVGTIIAVTTHLTGSPSLPATGTVNSDGWQFCDGAAIPGGNTLSGNSPNLTDTRFLAGTTLAGTTGTALGQNSVTLAACHIPSLSGSSAGTVTHSHTMSGYAGANDGAHTHSIYDPGHGHTINTWSGNSDGTMGIQTTAHPADQLNGYTNNNYTSITVCNTNSNHCHSIANATAASCGASFTGTSTYTNASPTAVATLPQYMTVKYLIRVK